jgi:hypothetical protein
MNQVQARQYVVDNVTVTRQQFLLMKSLLLKHYHPQTEQMLYSAIKEIGAQKPSAALLHSTVDAAPVLIQLIGWISWGIAGCEALWSLVHSDLLISAASSVNDFHTQIEWTTIIPGSGGERSGWNFPEFKVSYPHLVTRPRSANTPSVLCDPDLFLNEIAIPGIHAEVSEALRDAIRCFRSELYLPALVMLGEASEGAWIELGLAVIAALPEEERAKHEKQRADWSGADMGFAKKNRDSEVHRV